MKYLIILLFAILVNSTIYARISKQERKNEVLDVLDPQVHKYIDAKIKGMPQDCHREILNCKSPDQLNQISEKAQKWLADDLVDALDVKIMLNFEKLDEIRVGDDIYTVMSEALWCKIHGKSIDLDKKITLIGIYWEEQQEPEFNIAPLGKGKIEWKWTLEVKTRPHGILHIGIDVKSRKFICYERTIGIYYPEGKLLDRIRRDIVRTSPIFK